MGENPQQPVHRQLSMRTMAVLEITPTIIYGADVRPGPYPERISHYNVLSTILAMYHLPPLTDATPIRTIWEKMAARHGLGHELKCP
jgi:hypothetical protein